MSLSKLYEEWFKNPNWWFNCSTDIDKYLTDTYKPLLDIKHEPSSKEEMISYII